MTHKDWISDALSRIGEMSSKETDGKWLEHLTVECAPQIAEWDIEESWMWNKWPERMKHGYGRDIGIDVVARRSDGKYVAIQCKSRKLSEDGKGSPVTWRELSTFFGVSAENMWGERWIVTNGDVSISDRVPYTGEKPMKLVNLRADLLKQLDLTPIPSETYPHCDDSDIQTRDCMQKEAVSESIRILQEISNGPTGVARGRIVLPCGTGKSRIALRIVEHLTQKGEVSVVLVPSIALVAQLRREFLFNAQEPLRVIAVCSDDTAGSGSDLSTDPTVDTSKTKASEVKGTVTTNAAEIAGWMNEINQNQKHIGIIFSTYQSSHQIADALKKSDKKQLSTVIADEAHRTAGLRRIQSLEKKLRDFTVCHDQSRFPAKFRIYQTATPKVYKLGRHSPRKNDKWVVRSMDDQSVFGVELYRRSYMDAVKNKWLSDYRIIAIGVNDEDAYTTANNIAAESDRKLSTTNSLRGLALALVMGGVLRDSSAEIKSSINFVNTIRKSKEFTKLLQRKDVRDWVQRRMTEWKVEGEAANYRLEHLDASSTVSTREEAKARLAAGTMKRPHGVINVGIFGEGTDAPSLSAVGFLEARKSPVDVIQAVGRVMRRSPGKKMGYIICPIVIPPGTDAETWLCNSGPDDGWKELGQILLALRAHDSRIEDELSNLMDVVVPSFPPERVTTLVTLGRKANRAEHYEHHGKPGEVEKDVVDVLRGEVKPGEKLKPINQASSPERIVSGYLNKDGSVQLYEGGVVREKSKADGTPAPVNIPKSKKKGKEMLNGKEGRKISPKRPRPQDHTPHLFEYADAAGITINLLERSGLGHNRPQRDVNILRESIEESTEYLLQDELASVLDSHFNLDALDDNKRKSQADGCTIASLLLMNASMLHQRIASGGWLNEISTMDKLKNSVNTATKFHDQWNDITCHDFVPVMKPAIDVIRIVRDSGRLEGLNRALRHLSAEAERIAESYADLGADHAGPLFNQVMGNQASDGAFFSRPPVASLLARLTLDIAEKNGGGRIGLSKKHGRSTVPLTLHAVRGHC